MKRTLLFVSFVFISMCSMAQLPAWLPSNGLVAWYPFNGNANDGSGHNFNGFVNGPTLTTDRFSNPNSAYAFNGISGNIQVTDNILLRLSVTDYTISVWIYNTATASGNLNAILSKRLSTLSSGYILGVEGLTLTDPNKIMFQVSGGTDPKAISTDSIALNTWMNIMITYNHTTQDMNIYLNGVLNSTTPTIPTPSLATSPALFIGNDAGGSPYCFNGSIDDIAIYNRILSACERYELINQLAIVVTTQPVSQNYAPGDTVTFSVASADSCLSYQWQSNCGTGYTNLANTGIYEGVTNDTLVLNGVSGTMNNCKFRCVISSCFLCADTSSEGTLHSTAGINQPGDIQYLGVSPSPASDMITVQMAPHQYTGLSIYNVLGKLVYATSVDGSSEIKLNISFLPKGLYMLAANSPGDVTRYVRFVKD